VSVCRNLAARIKVLSGVEGRLSPMPQAEFGLPVREVQSPAARAFAQEPARTGHRASTWLPWHVGSLTVVGWIAQYWSLDPTRVARPWWFVSESAYGKAWALVQSPGQFRVRGVFITDTALQRV